MEYAIGLLMGIVYIAPPGPVNVETLRRGARGGFSKAAAFQGGALIGDMFYALLAVMGARTLLDDGALRILLGLAGTLYLVYLGVSTLRDRNSLSPQAEPVPAAFHSLKRTFGAGTVVALLNPFAVAFWVTVGGSAAANYGASGPLYLGGFVCGCVLCSALVALLAGGYQARLSPGLVRGVSLLCGLGMIYYGLQLGVATWQFSQM